MNLPTKYRPKTLADVVGQPVVTCTLTNALTRSQINSAYLFVGPRGVGKTSTARILAKSVNCQTHERPTPKPCGHCQTCREIERGSALDVVEIDAASNNGVDEIRNLIERVSLTPIARQRVVILDEAHCMTSNAANALLKTIERDR